MRSRRNSTLTSVRGVKVGSVEDPDRHSGVTAVVFDRLAPTVVDIRGPASGTFDTGSLALDATFGRRDAIFLSGGSVYGLDAGRGLRTALLDLGRGEGVFGSDFPLPRISGAVLYDLPRQPGAPPDYLPMGFGAGQAATGEPVAMGRRGAGAGARVGKYRGLDHSSEGGLSSAATAIDGRHRIGVLIVFNSVGAIRDAERGVWLSGPKDRRGRIVAPGAVASARPPHGAAGTTLAIVVTDLPLDRRALWILAEHVHDGIARVVVPAHTATEGDTVFAASTAPASEHPATERRPGATIDRLSMLAEGLVQAAALRLFPGSRRGA